MKIESEYNEDIAILTGGPSLPTVWDNAYYAKFREVWAINMVGNPEGPAPFLHDYLYYLDTPDRIFGRPDWKQWPTTMKGYRDRKTVPIDGECGVTFPACFDYVMRKSRASARIWIYGWDCSGVGVVDGQDWVNGRTSHERYLMNKYWNPDKVATVFGGMKEWARDEMGFAAGPINQFSKPCPPPRTRAEAREEANP